MARTSNTLWMLAGLALFAGMGAVVLSATVSDPVASIAEADAAIHYPQSIDRTCRDGRAKLYDECSDQREVYEAAMARARSENKVLLVSYGAEWCIWCQVFAAYINGQHDTFTHTYSDWDDAERFSATIHERATRDMAEEAEALKAYVASQFVIAHIDSRYAEGGEAVLAASGADASLEDWIPHIYTVRADGSVGGVFDHDRVAIRRDSDDWYRGYDRTALLTHLKEMAGAAQ